MLICTLYKYKSVLYLKISLLEIYVYFGYNNYPV